MADLKRYQIGEFSRLGSVSIKTLRFYDHIGLLRPASIDVRTRYRFYHAAQLRELAAIRALQDLGAPLADIRRVLASPEGDERRRLLARLRSQALHTLDATRRSLDWIDHELEAEPQRLDISVFLKQRDEVPIASIRARLDDYPDIAPLEAELARAVHPRYATERRGVLWHRCAASGAIEGEPFVELRGQPVRARGIELGCLPAARVATAYCDSDDDSVARTYEAIDRWIHRHELRLQGPKRENYVGSLLEVQFPVVAR